MYGPNGKKLVKIGYATNPEERRKKLSHSSGIPKAFQIYALYKVPVELADKKLHSLIMTLNPALKLDKEFFIMEPEDAYKILEAMSFIHGTSNCLTKLKLDSSIIKNTNKKNKKKKIFKEENKNNDKYFLYPSIPNITNKKLVNFCFMSKTYYDNVTYSKMLSIIADNLYQNYPKKILNMASDPNIKFISKFSFRFRSYELSKDCFINLNFSSRDILKMIKKIMDYCEINLSEFYFCTE